MLPSAVISEVSALIAKGGATEALIKLSKLKAERTGAEGVDLLRATCFLQLKDPLHARAAVLEELRLHPQNSQAQLLFASLDFRLRKFFHPPADILQTEPEFAMCYESLRCHTMLSWQRLLSLYHHAKKFRGKFPTVVECGSAAGGSAVLLAIAAQCPVYACDTFQGMPPPTLVDRLSGENAPAEDKGWGTGTCSAPEDRVKELADAFQVEVIPVKGLFAETLPKLCSRFLEARKINLLHCDADWYQSTKDVFDCLKNHFVAGTVVQVDDYYYWKGCSKATNEFLSDFNNRIQPQNVDGNACWFEIQ